MPSAHFAEGILSPLNCANEFGVLVIYLTFYICHYRNTNCIYGNVYYSTNGNSECSTMIVM